MGWRMNELETVTFSEKTTVIDTDFDSIQIRDGYANGFQDYFQFNGRPIWYFTRLSEDKSVRYITYIDL